MRDKGHGIGDMGKQPPTLPASHPHEKLLAWQRSMELVAQCYGLARSFPDDQRYGLVSQIQRASVSVPANIAEGAARNGWAETRHFYVIATSSLMELDTLVMLAHQLGFASQQSTAEVRSRITVVSKLLNGMIRYQTHRGRKTAAKKVDG